VARSQCLLVFINQIRMKIGVMFGSPETTTGGNALKFYASVRLDIRRVGAIKEAATGGKDPTVVGNRTRVKVVKNKLAPPFREVEFDILYGHGISRSGDILDLAVEDGIVEKSGAWFSFQGERIGQGRENARAFLEQHPEKLNRAELLVLEKHGIHRKGDAPKGDGAKGDGAKSDGTRGDGAKVEGAKGEPARPANGPAPAKPQPSPAPNDPKARPTSPAKPS